jgi:hypothetical protein
MSQVSHMPECCRLHYYVESVSSQRTARRYNTIRYLACNCHTQESLHMSKHVSNGEDSSLIFSAALEQWNAELISVTLRAHRNHPLDVFCRFAVSPTFNYGTQHWIREFLLRASRPNKWNSTFSSTRHNYFWYHAHIRTHNSSLTHTHAHLIPICPDNWRNSWFITKEILDNKFFTSRSLRNILLLR